MHSLCSDPLSINLCIHSFNFSQILCLSALTDLNPPRPARTLSTAEGYRDPLKLEAEMGVRVYVATVAALCVLPEKPLLFHGSRWGTPSHYHTPPTPASLFVPTQPHLCLSSYLHRPALPPGRLSLVVVGGVFLQSSLSTPRKPIATHTRRVLFWRSPLACPDSV